MKNAFEARLRAFVDRWYADPLRDEDGNTAAEIEAAERALGAPFPLSLRTWFRLLGRRVRDVQNQFCSLENVVSLRTHPECPDRRWGDLRCAPVFYENQGNWGIAVPLGGRARNPPTVLRPDPVPYENPPWGGHRFEAVAFSMLTTETLISAQPIAGSRVSRGPLGALRSGVIGSYLEGHRRPLRCQPSRCRLCQATRASGATTTASSSRSAPTTT